ncbi:MAG: TIGR02147 family protein [Chitinivibrionales bacterium]|nr:TIGR02147 family protein [Chitinivibrionales bacterium]
MPTVYEYMDYRAFLRDHCAERRKSMPGFSYRLLSKRAGISSSGFLSWVVNGRRNLSTRLALDIAKALKLTKSETAYFTSLVNFNQAGDTAEKNHYFDELRTLRPASPKSLRDEQREYYSKWYYAAIRELVAVCPVTGNYTHVARLLKPSIRPNEARRALELLERLGLIRKDRTGRYRQTDTLITSAGAPIEPACIHRYQSDTMELAAGALQRFDKDERDVSTVTMSVNAQSMALIRKRAEQFRAEVMAIARTSPDPDRVMQLNIQLFPLSGELGPGDNS